MIERRHGACTSPAPTRVGGNGSFFADATSFFQSAIPLSDVDVSAHRAAHPATCGVAVLVPLFIP